VGLLTREEARAFYDRWGAKQDTQAYYEDPASAELIAHAAFADAESVFEFGCGTGRFAERLLLSSLPPSATYLGIDLSATMVDLARTRLSRFEPRAEVRLTDGSPPGDLSSNTFDRFVSTYVLDLLSQDDIRAVIAEAHRILKPPGLLCLTSLTRGCTTWSRILMGVWKMVHACRPSLVGGCRSIELLEYLPSQQWEIRHRNRIVAYGMPSEVVIAAKR
jgi:ubiquinone/menaquinone biosynthesis C-methylase UbiE